MDREEWVVVVVSHELPVIVKREGEGWRSEEREGHRAMYSGIASIEGEKWVVGWHGGGESKEREEYLRERGMVEVTMGGEREGFYEGFCKGVLWRLFHYVSFANSNSFSSYETANRRYAAAISSLLSSLPQKRIAIFINDYHLLLLPALIPPSPRIRIGLFLHTPFPSSELFRTLPHRSLLLKATLASHLIGFQTFSHARHFISSCSRILSADSSPSSIEYNGHSTSIGIFPIGIDTSSTSSLLNSPTTSLKISSIKSLFPNVKIIFAKDKLDSVSGVIHKLRSFHKFLSSYPSLKSKVILIQVTSPSKNTSPSFSSKLSDLISKINGSFGSLDFLPVHHYHQHLSTSEYLALLSVADIALITPLRDGMNTTAHDFILAQQLNKGSLILSEFAGAAGSMAGAFLVNPWDYSGVAAAINDALSLPLNDRIIRHNQLLSHVNNHTAAFWASSFLADLTKSQSSSISSQHTTPALDTHAIIHSYSSSSQRLLMFDYDGTLTPIKKLPAAATPPPDMLAALSILVSDPKNLVFVISGRDQATLDTWLGHIPNLGLSAEHGSFIKYPSGSWINLASEIDLSWKQQVHDIFSFFTERTQGSFIETKRYAITWHYRLADPDYGSFQAKECRNHLENSIVSKLPVEILSGKKNLEVRPIAMNKGEIVRKLISGRIGNGGCDFVYCVGDDRTDEDMFKAVSKYTSVDSAGGSGNGIVGSPGSTNVSGNSNGITSVDTNPSETSSPTSTPTTISTNSKYFTCTIGPASKKTHAQWHVTSPQDVINLMIEFAKISRGDVGMDDIVTGVDDVKVNGDGDGDDEDESDVENIVKELPPLGIPPITYHHTRGHVMSSGLSDGLSGSVSISENSGLNGTVDCGVLDMCQSDDCIVD